MEVSGAKCLNQMTYFQASVTLGVKVVLSRFAHSLDIQHLETPDSFIENELQEIIIKIIRPYQNQG